ncbi:hypothetical protein BKA93DRAFT_799786 [Sparassis latifolia]
MSNSDTSTALLFVDFAITFPNEVQRIWRRKFSGATIVFLLNRYVALAERVTLVTSVFLVTNNDQSCVPVLRLDDCLNALSSVISGVFLVLRVWGIWGRDWRPHLILVPMCLAAPICDVYVDTHYTPIAFGGPLFGCGADIHLTLRDVNIISIVSGTASIFNNCLVLLLTWIKTYAIKRESARVGLNTPLATLLLRDGTIYFCLLVFTSIFSIIASQAGSSFVLFDVWTYFNQVLVVIFLSRFMLDLRGIYPAEGDVEQMHTISIGRISDLDFATSVVGNMGAPLTTGQPEKRDSLEFVDPYEEDGVAEDSRNPLMSDVMPLSDEIEVQHAKVVGVPPFFSVVIHVVLKPHLRRATRNWRISRLCNAYDEWISGSEMRWTCRTFLDYFLRVIAGP